jgi:hypothetical protein
VNKRKSRGKGSNKGNKDDGHASSGYDSAVSTGSCCCDQAEIGGRRGSTARNTATNRRHHTAVEGVVGGSEGHDMSTVLRDGRVQALIEGLWTKVVSTLLLRVVCIIPRVAVMLCRYWLIPLDSCVALLELYQLMLAPPNNSCTHIVAQDNAETASQRLKQELDGYRGAMSRIEATLSQVAGTTQMETLALVVEEQRRRIDSILTGTA